MKYRALGGSGIQVSCIGLGGNIFGHFCGARETADILDAARALGVNLIDTSDTYSNGLSERIIGQCVCASRDEWVLATKVGASSGISFDGKGRREHILGSVERSLKRLRTDRIDLYQMHHFDPATPIDETWAALDLLKRQGKVRSVGASNYSISQVIDTLGVARSRGYSVPTALQQCYNMFRREAERDILSLCARERVGVLAYGVLARGVLGGRYDEGVSFPSDSRAASSRSVRMDLTATVLHVVARLKGFAANRGRSLATIAVAWVLRRPEVTAVIAGIRSPSQLAENAAAVEWAMSKDDEAEVQEIVGDSRLYESLSMGASAAANAPSA